MASNSALTWRQPPIGTGVRLLSLDGGGVRGLSALMILQQLMVKINRKSPPLPCDYFDMIGGTGTGGLIAIMLGRLRMSVDECIEEYMSLSDEVFATQKKHKVSLTGKLQARFDTDKLEQAIKKIITRRGLDQDALLKDGGPCKVFVCATSAEILNPVCLRSYPTDRGSIRLNHVKIWEACRATMAATTLFDPISIGPYGETFVDGAFGNNNPVGLLWTEAHDVFDSREIQCLVSIGAGAPPSQPLGDNLVDVFNTLRGLAIETEQTAELFHRSHDDGHYYYRFNVNRGLETIGLEQARKKNEIAAATHWYIETQAVFKQLQACAKALAGAEHDLTFNGGPVVPKYHLPFYKNDNFVGREDELEQLRLWLFGDVHPAGIYEAVALHGLGGIGTTQVANAFAHWTKETQKDCSVFWVPAISEADFEKAYMAIATKLGIWSQSTKQDVKTLVCNYLSSEAAGKWLLVIDNLDDPSLINLQQYFPKSDNGRILVTTRKQEISIAVAQKTLEIGALDLPWAKQLATRLLRPGVPGDDVSMVALLEELECFPLAITQALAFLNDTRQSAGKYLGLLRNSEEDKIALLSNELPDRTRYAKGSQHAVATTWLVSFRHLQERSPDAIRLLEFLSEVQPKAIPASMLPQFGSVSATNIAVSRLCDYSFVSWQNDNVLDMHVLVHLATRNWIKNNGHSKRVTRDALRHMCSIFPEPSYENRDVWRDYLPHALHMLRDGEAVDSEAVLQLYLRVGRALLQDGSMTEALQCFQYCNKWATESLPEDHKSQLKLQIELANAYQSCGQKPKAAGLLGDGTRDNEKAGVEHRPPRFGTRNGAQDELVMVYRPGQRIDPIRRH